MFNSNKKRERYVDQQLSCLEQKVTRAETAIDNLEWTVFERLDDGGDFGLRLDRTKPRLNRVRELLWLLFDHLGLEEKTIGASPERTVLVKKSKKRG